MITDTLRGVVIALLCLLLALVPGVPNAPLASTPLLLGIGLALQLAMLALRRFVHHQERAHGVEGSWLPTVNHVAALLVDGLTVLLVAIALLQGRFAVMSAI